MTHKISKEDAILKYERELEKIELQKQGKLVKSDRLEKKRKRRESKYQKFVNILKSRGGHAEQKKKNTKGGNENVR